MFETGWNREKLGLVLGDYDKAAAFFDSLGTETAIANRVNSIIGNTVTARRIKRQKEYAGTRSTARKACDSAS